MKEMEHINRRGQAMPVPAGNSERKAADGDVRRSPVNREPEGRRPRLSISHGLEVFLFTTILLLANLPLLSGTVQTAWVLLPDAVMQGEWQRVLLHPWVHVSPYHLLLDAGAFLTLFFMLDRKRPRERWGIFFAAWIGSSLSAWFFDPAIQQVGFCGLSGIGHGLFAAVCVQWMRRPELQTPGAVLLVGVMAKVIYEAGTGSVFLAGLHAGDVGIPLTVCHLGGVVAGWLSATSCIALRGSPTSVSHFLHLPYSSSTP